jgi:hypothetical protein
MLELAADYFQQTIRILARFTSFLALFLVF